MHSQQDPERCRAGPTVKACRGQGRKEEGGLAQAEPMGAPQADARHQARREEEGLIRICGEVEEQPHKQEPESDECQQEPDRHTVDNEYHYTIRFQLKAQRVCHDGRYTKFSDLNSVR